ncbi:MAG: amidinotransferase [Bacteroidetes bacterium]|nr:amidinotransferase [Bacteroidota bacterium]
MIRPVGFAFNAQTAVNNAFQQESAGANTQQLALQEFDAFVTRLREAGVQVTVVEDTPEPATPDSIFPNNWVSFHEDGTVFLYPMFAINRRAERKPHVIETIREQFKVGEVIDFTDSEKEGLFLEGTGSMVLDRANKIAYACISPRTDRTLFEKWCERAGFTPCSFNSVDDKGGAVYHTNVMMCVADRYVVICLESIPDEKEKKAVIEQLERSGKTIISISLFQMNHFAGNMLQVENLKGEKILVMSQQAYDSLNTEQIQTLAAFNTILTGDLSTIETNGGGSARCMMAEVFLPKK